MSSKHEESAAGEASAGPYDTAPPPYNPNAPPQYEGGVPVVVTQQPGAAPAPAAVFAPGTGAAGAAAAQPGQPTVVYMQQQPGQPVPVNLTVTVQPEAVGAEQMMPAPPRIPNCPDGLEYLAQLGQLLIKQKVEMFEAFTGFETVNKYTIKNAMGQPVYKAKEQSGCLTRQCCGPLRPFDMAIRDNFGREVIHLNRPLRCESCCCFCCLQELEVTAGNGETLGTVEQEWSVLIPVFRVKDAHGKVVLRIKGPFLTCSCCGSDVEFKVLSPGEDEREVGVITKQWSGFLREGWSDSDNFGVSFPVDLDVRMKATLLGAVFLIDFMFFEKAGDQANDGVGMIS